jgi:N-acetylglucosaminyldiphosphoundecaprenol N-acetyl-beta-D-mannosaminyltransferase
MRITILNIPIDVVDRKSALLRIEGFLRSEGQFHVMTPNPEMLVEAHKNSEFKKILQEADLNLPDGAGLVFEMKKIIKRKRQTEIIERVTGTDIMQDICSRTSERIFLLGASSGIAEEAAAKLKERNPSLQIVGTYAGSPKIEDENIILEKINSCSPTLLFVAFGAPAQDMWIARNLNKLPSVKIAMGIGGAFDFISGKRKRAPQCMQKLGLEWLWRLILEPRRIKRIWRAVVVFPIVSRDTT